MKFFPAKIMFLTSVFALLLLGGCDSAESDQTAAIANPASEYCVKRGGKLEIVKEASGDKGVCHLPDGRVIEEWELFRRDNSQK